MQMAQKKLIQRRRMRPQSVGQIFSLSHQLASRQPPQPLQRRLCIPTRLNDALKTHTADLRLRRIWRRRRRGRLATARGDGLSDSRADQCAGLQALRDQVGVDIKLGRLR